MEDLPLVAWLLVQPCFLALQGTATAAVGLCAVRALCHELDLAQPGSASHETPLVLGERGALLAPLAASASLLLFFYLFPSVQHVLLAGASVAAVWALAFLVQPLADALLQEPRAALPARATRLLQALPTALGVAAVGAWLLTGSLALGNLLAVGLCSFIVAHVRMRSLKVACLLLALLFCYDVFWVFFSKAIFGSNVMVEASQRQASNLAKKAAQAAALPGADRVPAQLALPMKLGFRARLLSADPDEPQVMLGLGDIAVPALVVSLLLLHDYHAWSAAASGSSSRTGGDGSSGSSRRDGGGPGLRVLLSPRFWLQSYTLPAWAGYAVGLAATLVAGILSEAAQPALLYLVPLTLGPPLALAARRGDWTRLWAPPKALPPGSVPRGKELDV